jgi:hypothetical protein
MRSYVHSRGKYAVNGSFSGNIDFYQDLTLQFSCLTMSPFLGGGCSRFDMIAGRLLPEVPERECGLRVGFTGYGSCDDPFKLSIMI